MRRILGRVSSLKVSALTRLLLELAAISVELARELGRQRIKLALLPTRDIQMSALRTIARIAGHAGAGLHIAIACLRFSQVEMLTVSVIPKLRRAAENTFHGFLPRRIEILPDDESVTLMLLRLDLGRMIPGCRWLRANRFQFANLAITQRFALLVLLAIQILDLAARALACSWSSGTMTGARPACLGGVLACCFARSRRSWRF
jgi:hypothetical protein